MPSAIILLSTTIGTERALLRSLRKHRCVVEAYVVQSAYDIIVKVKAETFDKLTTIISKIKRLVPTPQSVTTMVIVEDSTGH